MRRIILLLTLIIAASSLALGQTNANSSNRNSGASAQCAGTSLSVRHVDDDAAMGGFRSTTYAFTNKSTAPCTLNGYPRVELLNSKGKAGRRATNKEQLAADTEKTQPQLVTIEPGKTAWFLIQYNSGGAGHMGKPCTTYPKIKIIAPGTTRAFLLRDGIQSCRGTEFEVSPVRSAKPQ